MRSADPIVWRHVAEASEYAALRVGQIIGDICIIDLRSIYKK
jgi:hypothetical protein